MRAMGWVIAGMWGLLCIPALAQWLIAGAAMAGVCLLLLSAFGLVGRYR